MAVRTRDQPMLHALCCLHPVPASIELRVTFLSCFLLSHFWFFHIRLHKGWRRRFLFLQFLDAGKRDTQQFLRLPQSFSQGLVFGPKLGIFFLWRHGLSFSEKVKSEQFPVILIRFLSLEECSSPYTSSPLSQSGGGNIAPLSPLDNKVSSMVYHG